MDAFKPFATVTVRYSCDPCGVHDKALEVRARDPGEPITEWVYWAVYACGIDHHTVFENCQAECLSALQIPMTGAEFIGGPIVQ